MAGDVVVVRMPILYSIGVVSRHHRSAILRAPRRDRQPRLRVPAKASANAFVATESVAEEEQIMATSLESTRLGGELSLVTARGACSTSSVDCSHCAKTSYCFIFPSFDKLRSQYTHRASQIAFAIMSNRAFLTIGGVVAAGGAYYLYKAGGDPKAAEKRFERKRDTIESMSHS